MVLHRRELHALWVGWCAVRIRLTIRQPPVTAGQELFDELASTRIVEVQLHLDDPESNVCSAGSVVAVVSRSLSARRKEYWTSGASRRVPRRASLERMSPSSKSCSSCVDAACARCVCAAGFEPAHTIVKSPTREWVKDGNKVPVAVKGAYMC